MLNEIKNLYVVDWMGPYKSIDVQTECVNDGDICFYLITGKLSPEDSEGIRFFGIKGNESMETNDSEKLITSKQYWFGKFCNGEDNAFTDAPNHRKNDKELVRNIIVNYISMQKGTDYMVNDKVSICEPNESVFLTSRIFIKNKKDSNDNIYKLNDLPEALMFANGCYHDCGKLKTM